MSKLLPVSWYTKSMRKHLAVFKTGLQDSFAYRSENVVWMIVEFLPIIMLSFVWLDVFEKRGRLGGYDKEELITYYIGAFFIGRFVSWYIHHGIAREIRHGILSNFLVKPYHYLVYHAVSNSARRIQRYITLIPFLLLLLANFRQYLYIDTNFLRASLVLLALILAFLLFLSVSVLLGIFAFWVQKVDGLYNLYWVLRNIFSGNIIPLALLPSSFLFVAKLLPFRYTFSFPLEIYFKKLTNFEILNGFLFSIFWLSFNYFLLKVLWSRGLKRYASYGG